MTDSDLDYELWPEPYLEAVPICPICRDSRRQLLHSELVDRVFRVAPGRWTLWNCMGCGSAYLDPRPNVASIHMAYSNYYTHQAPPLKKPYLELGPLRKCRRRLLNGYTNYRFGTRASPASSLGILLFLLLRKEREKIDGEFRHLPKPIRGKSKLLEVGFGRGTFLEKASSCGWIVFGVDTDEQVIAAALQRGFNVSRGGIEVFNDLSEEFDAIVMNHVIEHVHNPITVLERCYRLLRPGGSLYIETPNINSIGHRYFGSEWRDLDPPRHLVLFTPNSLRYALEAAGFSCVAWKGRSNPINTITLDSSAIRQNLPIESNKIQTTEEVRFVRRTSRVQSRRPELREYITFMASKQCRGPFLVR